MPCKIIIQRNDHQEGGRRNPGCEHGVFNTAVEVHRAERQFVLPVWRYSLLLHEIIERCRASHRAKLGRVVRDGLQRLGRFAEIALLAIFILSLECFSDQPWLIRCAGWLMSGNDGGRVKPLDPDWRCHTLTQASPGWSDILVRYVWTEELFIHPNGVIHC